MDINQQPLILSPESVPFLEVFTTPAWVEAEGIRFMFDSELECYRDAQGRELYIEPSQTDGVLTADAYYEMPEA